MKTDNDSSRQWSHRTVGKMDLINYIVAEAGCTKTLATKVVELFLNGAAEALVAGKRVELRRFGCFDIAKRAPRTARNPGTGESISVPVRRVVKFKAGSELARALANCGLDQEEAA